MLDDVGLEVLKAASSQRIAVGRLELDLGLEGAGPSGPLPITSSRMGRLLDALDRGYRVLGLEDAAGGGGEVFRQLALARIIESTMPPVIEAAVAAHELPDVTIVAGVGMIPDAKLSQLRSRRPVPRCRRCPPPTAARTGPFAGRTRSPAPPKRSGPRR